MNLDDCKVFNDGEKRNACAVSVAENKSDVSICDGLDDVLWKIICYKQLNATDKLAAIKTTTTRPSTTTTTLRATTTTTLPACGNGRLDNGEECDVGSLCSHADGVCSIMGGVAVCLYNTSCDWSIQYSTDGKDYNMGPCTSCYSPNHKFGCMCFRAGVSPGLTTSTTLSGGHLSCVNGLCKWVKGEGENECSRNMQCYHFECEDKECKQVMEPGENECEKNIDCETWYD